MSLTLIDLRAPHGSAADDGTGLSGCLAQLVGEPFRFARVSYGDELTLHFGELRPARSLKLKDYFYGAYLLGTRGSSWILKSGGNSTPLVLSAGATLDSPPSDLGRALGKEELESGQFIEAESRVLAAIPFFVKALPGFGLQLVMSDGSTLFVIPTAFESEEPGDEALAGLADWELLSPLGLLRAGPGVGWSFEPRRRD